MIKAIIFDFNRTLYDPDKGKLFSCVNNLLLKLSKRYKLVLVTTLNQKNRIKVLEDLSIDRFFEFIEILSKKDVKDFEKVIKRLELKPEEILVVGDVIFDEIRIANILGMVTVWLKKGKFSTVLPRNKKEEPSFIIYSLEGLINVLKIHNKF